MHGFEVAIQLESIDRPLFVMNSSVALSKFGLRLWYISTQITLDGNTFTAGDRGIHAYDIHDMFLSNSLLSRYTDTALYIKFSAINQVTLTDTVISNGDQGVCLYKITQHGDSVRISLSGVNLHNNRKHLCLDIGDFKNSDSVLVALKRNIFVDGHVLTIDGRKDGEQIVWNIANNEFHNMTGRLMQLRGRVNFTSNVIRNITYTGGVLVDIRSATADTWSLVKGNTFERNNNVSSILSLCYNGRLLQNSFLNNHIINSLITCMYSNIPASTQQLVGNTIVNNTASSRFNTYSAAVSMKWPSTAEAHGNTFANPSLTYEVVIRHPTLNTSMSLDFSDNYWGTSDPRVINGRILDGRYTGWSPMIRLSHNDTGQPFDTAETLHGRVDKSLTLRRRTDPYPLSGDLVVPAGVTLTLEAGVTLALQRTTSLFIEGRLEAKGTTDSPVRLQRSANLTQVMPLRLVNGDNEHEGRLEALVGSVWLTFCRTGWTANNSDVACRQLGFGKGKSNSLMLALVLDCKCNLLPMIITHGAEGKK